MEKINIVKLLKDCPEGMELDCTTYNDVTFLRVDETQNRCYFRMGRADTFWTTCDGRLNYSDLAKCVIFPKGKTTWEGFVPPGKFKDGDILVGNSNHTFIYYKKMDHSYGCVSHCGIDCKGKFHLTTNDWSFSSSLRFATEEEKEKLFNAIKENGYSWNAETKTLEKLVVPKFKVGNRIKSKIDQLTYIITGIRSDVYTVYTDIGKFNFHIPFSMEKNYELVPNKFNIVTLKAFESRVLVRDKNTDEWRGQFFSHYYESKRSDKPYICIGVEGLCEYKQCIPFENNEYLLGTTDDCNDFYKTWK